ncbi:MAG: hypothetical protein MMC33_003984 [Icmadophila ericetorum]|nr:hypothetical protein [Icmadophila ericetorum]
MASINLSLVLVYLCTLLLLSIPSLALSGGVVHVPLERGHSGHFKSVRHHHDIHRRQEIEDDILTFNGQLWFAPFRVGNSNLNLSIDTGSADVAINTGRYSPSYNSLKLNQTAELRYGFNKDSPENSDIQVMLYADDVNFGGMTAKNLTIGDQYTGAIQVPGDGIVGFGGGTATNSTSFFERLCEQGSVQECRFGLALWDNDSGSQHLGGVDHSKFSGQLSVAAVTPIFTSFRWAVHSDIVIDGKVFFSNVRVSLDSGTTYIYGPIDQVIAIFEEIGIMPVWQDPSLESGGATVTGYYPCDLDPQFGFRFPSQADVDISLLDSNSPVSTESENFYLMQDAFRGDFTKPNNCTSVVLGTNLTDGVWLVGQAFFLGKYVDHNFAAKTMGFANLRPDLRVNSTAADTTRHYSSNPLVWITVVSLGVLGASLLTSG